MSVNDVKSFAEKNIAILFAKNEKENSLYRALEERNRHLLVEIENAPLNGMNGDEYTIQPNGILTFNINTSTSFIIQSLIPTKVNIKLTDSAGNTVGQLKNFVGKATFSVSVDDNGYTLTIENTSSRIAKLYIVQY